MSVLDGTLPVYPFHPDGFVGTLQADGQQVRVAALACQGRHVVVLSLVGFDTSIGVVLSRLWSLTAVSFLPAPAWTTEWSGPEQLARGAEHYKQCVAHLDGTREVHALAFLRTAHLTEGILHPPDLPQEEKVVEDAIQQQQTKRRHEQPEQHEQQAQQPKPPKWVPRYILSNWNEIGPHRQSFLGHLYALRVLFLHRHLEHPEWPEQWADALWDRGCTAGLITPLDALGLRGWKLSGDLTAWSKLVGAGVREGWLPWQ